MKLEISRDEAALLESVLTQYVSELRSEIAHTDNFSFRQGLKDREAALRTMLVGLKAELYR